MRRISLLALVVAALGGCGGDDGDALTAAEYRTQANAICAETQEQLDDVELEGNDVAAYFDETIPIAEDRRDRLDDLQPPEELGEAHDRMVSSLDDVIGAAEDLKSAAESTDAEEIQAATARGAEHQESLDDAAEELGVDDCGS